MIKKKRRNPIDLDYVCRLAEAIYTGSPHRLSNALIYKKQGQHCQDCNTFYWNCECEKCTNTTILAVNSCGTNYCICEYYKNDITGTETSKISWKLALQLNDIQFSHLIAHLLRINRDEKNPGNQFAEKIVKNAIILDDLNELKRKIKL